MDNGIPITWNESLGRLEDHHLDHQARWIRKDLAPGTSAWMKNARDEIAILLFVCPCGCSSVASIPVLPGYGGSCWHWDGNLERPTLNPSILRTAGCDRGWHGFLTTGVFVTC
jgi:hypothetical protein